MKSWSMLVADAARARFFSIVWSDDVETESSPKLQEQDDLVNPDAQLADRQVFTDRMGASSTRSGPRHAFEPSGLERKRVLSERFAQRIAERVGQRPGTKWVVAADKRMLGNLRKAMSAMAPQIELIEIPADLTRQPTMRILEGLVKRGIVEAPRVPRTGVFRAKGLAAQHG